MYKYIIEVRDSDGNFNPDLKRELSKKYPEFFESEEFTMFNLCWLASYAGGRNNPLGPMELGDFMKSIGLSYREKYW